MTGSKFKKRLFEVDLSMQFIIISLLNIVKLILTLCRYSNVQSSLQRLQAKCTDYSIATMVLAFLVRTLFKARYSLFNNLCYRVSCNENRTRDSTFNSKLINLQYKTTYEEKEVLREVLFYLEIKLQIF